jgi:hypothetical protein
MLRIILIAALFISLTTNAQQKNLSGYMIYLLGKDTTMAASYSLQGDNFEMTVLSRPNVTVTKMSGTLFPNGELRTAEGVAYKPGKDTVTRYKLFVKDDTTFISNNNNIQKFAAKGMIANAIGTPFRFLLAFWGNYAPKQIGDSIVSNHLTFGTGRRFVLKRIAPNKFYGGSGVMGMFSFYLDKKGNVDSIDGIGSSWNVTGKVLQHLDLNALTERFIASEKNGSGIAIINKLDSVQQKINNTSIKIIYSRPQVRDRQIFGSVLPWDRFWRTGANASTKMVIDHAIHFGDKILAAGEYSVWTIPSQKNWTVMFNSQANVWGTEYNPAYDVLRLPMQSTDLNELVETMTIQIVEVNNTGRLLISWEKLKASINFTAD